MIYIVIQDNVRNQLRCVERLSSIHTGHDKRVPAATSILRRSTTEGVGMLHPREDFNVVRAAYDLFDPDNKGHIEAKDLYRTCNQLGFTVSERDVDNMLAVLARIQKASARVLQCLASCGLGVASCGVCVCVCVWGIVGGESGVGWDRL